MYICVCIYVYAPEEQALKSLLPHYDTVGYRKVVCACVYFFIYAHVCINMMCILYVCMYIDRYDHVTNMIDMIMSQI